MRMMNLKPLAALFLLLAAAAHAGDSSPLLDATYAGDAARVAALIKAGADVNEANQFGATPMSQAALRGLRHRRGAELVGLVDIGAGLDERRNPRGIAGIGGIEQRGGVASLRRAGKQQEKHGKRLRIQHAHLQ